MVLRVGIIAYISQKVVIILRKRLVMWLCCVLICLGAYHWSGVELAGAKESAMKHLYQGITEKMFPQLVLYKMPQSQMIYNDIGTMMMPVMAGMGTSRPTSGSYASEEVTVPVTDVTINGTQSPKEDFPTNSGVATSPEKEPEEDITPIVSDKKVIINRIKLQDFDYLRQNFYQIDNSTTIGSDMLNVDKLLEKDMSLTENVKGPQILIYHTHSQEGYQDSASGDANTSVVAVGAYLAALLTEEYGIEVLHHKGEYDVENRSSAYSNALPAIQQVLKENPTIEVVIDLHRDGVPDTTHLVTEINGKQTAQIMFFNGLSRTTSQGNLEYLNNPYIEDNLAFSFQMQLAAAEYYPGLARRIYLKGYRYNMHVCPKTLLVEVGAQTNTFQEAKNAMEPLAYLLAKVLKTDKVP